MKKSRLLTPYDQKIKEHIARRVAERPHFTRSGSGIVYDRWGCLICGSIIVSQRLASLEVPEQYECWCDTCHARTQQVRIGSSSLSPQEAYQKFGKN